MEIRGLKPPVMFSVSVASPASVSTNWLLANATLVAAKSVRSIVSPTLNPPMLLMPLRPSTELSPDIVQSAPISNCNDAKLVMEVPSKPASAPTPVPARSISPPPPVILP